MTTPTNTMVYLWGTTRINIRTVFNLYMLPLSSVSRKHSVSFHSYADETQLHVTVSPDDNGLMTLILNFKKTHVQGEQK